MNQVKAGAFLNYVLIILSILTGLLYTPFMLRCLGQNEYGLYSLVASVISYLTLLDFGFGSAIVRYTARIRATGTPGDEWRLYGMFMAAYIVIGVLITAAGVVLWLNTDRMFDRTMTPAELSQARTMMALMVFNLAVTFPLSVYGSIISAYERFVFQRVVSIIRVLVSTAVMICVLLMGYKAVAMVVVQTVFSLASIALNIIYCYRKLHIRITFGHFDMPLLKEVAVFSFWNFLGAITDRIYWSTGQFILGIYSGPVAVAIFSVALTIMHLYMSLSTAFNGILLPRITTMAATGEHRREISDLFIRTGRLQFCVLALVLSGFIVFGQPFIQLWAGSGYTASYMITVIFMVALICPLIQNLGLTIIQARGQQKFRSLCYLVIAAVSLVAQIFVTPRYGAPGCAWVIALTLFAGQWVVMNIYYRRCQHIAIGTFWRQIARMAVVPAVFTALGLAAIHRLDLTSWYAIGSMVLVYVTAYIPAFYWLGMNTYERQSLIYPVKAALARIFS